MVVTATSGRVLYWGVALPTAVVMVVLGLDAILPGVGGILLLGLVPMGLFVAFTALFDPSAPAPGDNPQNPAGGGDEGNVVAFALSGDQSPVGMPTFRPASLVDRLALGLGIAVCGAAAYVFLFS
jgi:hypothetical protein